MSGSERSRHRAHQDITAGDIAMKYEFVYHENGRDLEVYSTRGSMIRRTTFDKKDKVVIDVTYEYDDEGRCLSAMVFGPGYAYAGVAENLYKEPYSEPIESIERDANDKLLNRQVFFFGDDNRAWKVECYDENSRILGVCYLKYDAGGSLQATECVDALGNRVESFPMKSIFMGMAGP